MTLVFKPTALVFSTALGAAGLLCLLLGKNLKIGNKRGVFLWMLPLMAAAGLWYRTLASYRRACYLYICRIVEKRDAG